MHKLWPLFLTLASCATSQERYAPSFATGFDVPETDGILIEWRGCSAAAPCIRGELGGKDYKLGFADAPSVLKGHVGDANVELQLDPGSVFRLGDHALEMIYTDADRRTALTLTWNERDQRPIDHRLFRND